MMLTAAGAWQARVLNCQDAKAAKKGNSKIYTAKTP